MRDHSQSTQRLPSVDILRGIAIVFMALDHVRDYVGAFPFTPEDLTNTYPALFFTRWITHYCAPTFFLLAGVSAYFLARRFGSMRKLSGFLAIRGFWLIVLELTIVTFAWGFRPLEQAQVIWALGWSMLLLSLLVFLDVRLIAVIALGMVFGHDALDFVRPERWGTFAWLCTILHAPGWIPNHSHRIVYVLYPLIPWVAVMALGYVLGATVASTSNLATKRMMAIGFACIALFVTLRATNAYGNPSAAVAFNSPGNFAAQPTAALTLIAFLDVEKYPPSLQYLLMTLGPVLIVLSFLRRTLDASAVPSWLRPLQMFGRVPLFFYVVHIYVAHALSLVIIALAGPSYQPSLAAVYATWIGVIVLMYWPCVWFDGLKRQHASPWLSFA